MTIQAYPKLRLLPRTETQTGLPPVGVDDAPAQEQFSGEIPLRNERPAAELLADRLSEIDPAATTLLFIP
jgi:hypothetical protein